MGNVGMAIGTQTVTHESKDIFELNLETANHPCQNYSPAHSLDTGWGGLGGRAWWVR